MKCVKEWLEHTCSAVNIQYTHQVDENTLGSEKIGKNTLGSENRPWCKKIHQAQKIDPGVKKYTRLDV